MNRKFIHQGDVQLIEVNRPSNLKSVGKRPVAYGEHSGHQHIVTGDYELLEDEKGSIFISVGNAGAALQHIHESVFRNNWESTDTLPMADHNPLTLDPGTFMKVGIHKKYNPYAKVWESVKD
jgi:hypothetical protein